GTDLVPALPPLQNGRCDRLNLAAQRASDPNANVPLIFRTPPFFISSAHVITPMAGPGLRAYNTQRKNMSYGSKISLRAAALLAAVALALSACGGDGAAASAAATGAEDDPIRIGVVTASEPYWEIFTDLAADEGIHVELVNFTDYQLPNQG